MARPTTITSEQILAAAREVFLEKGISGTTLEVARRAGIAEGSIFKRYKTKEHLFIEAMKPVGDVAPWAELLMSKSGQGEMRQNLIEVAHEVLAFFRGLMPLIMMAWSAAGTTGAPEHMRGPDCLPIRTLNAVSRFFEAEMRAGRIQRHDPEVLARAYIGSLQNYVFFEVMFKADDMASLPEEAFVRGMVNLLWRGIDPTHAPVRARSKRKRVSR
jgi:AcrR family transcriptional regulator